MKSAEFWISDINKLLIPFVGKHISSFDINQVYYWPPNGQIRSHSNPISESYRLRSLSQLQEIRFGAILLVPRMNNKIDAPELLCKKHPVMGPIFPSLFSHNRNFTSQEDIKSEVLSRANEVITKGKIKKVDYAGGMITFKKSITKRKYSCYIFPFYTLTTSLTKLQQDAAFYMAGREYIFLSKSEIESMDHQGPTADVYRVVEELFSTWGYFRSYVFESDRSTESELIVRNHSLALDVGLPFDIYRQLLKVLLDCGPFDSDNLLRAVFVDHRISIWRNALPQAHNPIERVKGLIGFLYNKYDLTQQNALILFLSVLHDNIASRDVCYQELANLVDELIEILPNDIIQ